MSIFRQGNLSNLPCFQDHSRFTATLPTAGHALDRSRVTINYQKEIFKLDDVICY